MTQSCSEFHQKSFGLKKVRFRPKVGPKITSFGKHEAEVDEVADNSAEQAEENEVADNSAEETEEDKVADNPAEETEEDEVADNPAEEAQEARETEKADQIEFITVHPSSLVSKFVINLIWRRKSHPHGLWVRS